MQGHRKLTMICCAAVLTLGLAACGGGGSDTSEGPPMPPPPTPYESAVAAIAAATTAADAQAAYDAVKDDVSASQGDALQDAVDMRIAALATAARAAMQRANLMTAAGNVDTSDLSTAQAIADATTAIAALQAAIDAAADVDDTSMYQTMVDNAEAAVTTAQGHLDTQGRMMAQRMAISNAVTMARTAVNGVNDDSTDSEVASADSAVAALQTAIDNAADLPDGDADVASAQGTLTTLMAQLNTAKNSRQAVLDAADEERAKQMAALGRSMRAALGGTPTAGTTALDNITSTALTATGPTPLTITGAMGAGALPDATDPGAAILRTGDSAGSLGGWAGTDYARTSGAGEAMVTNEARVYVNKGPGRSQPFTGTNGKYTLVSGQTGPDADNNGYLGSDTTTILDVSAAPADLARVRADAFTHSGTQTHAVPDRADALYVRGTYDGAPGEFRCETGCSSTNDGTGSPSVLGGTWNFKPDAGAMVNTPDADYLYYGWWVRKDNDGDPTAASAFVGNVGTDPATAGTPILLGWTGTTTPTGSATYAGHAAGKYAINNVLEASGHGGHFTADAEFEAKFSGSNAGINGTIDNFRLNDATEDPDWSVSLRLRAWGNDGAIGAAVDDPTTTADESAAGAGTVWSIGGNSASASGTWGGTMYDEKPGDPSATGPGDGSNIPTTMTGTFYSEFSTIGRMVGAFGADKQ